MNLPSKPMLNFTAVGEEHFEVNLQIPFSKTIASAYESIYAYHLALRNYYIATAAIVIFYEPMFQTVIVCI